jgi:carnitine-CoA ligase
VTIATLSPLDRTLPQMLTPQSAAFGYRPLITIGAQTWTFEQAHQIAARRGGTLRPAGIKRGDRVAALRCAAISSAGMFTRLAFTQQ